jgi:hypothetical protein
MKILAVEVVVRKKTLAFKSFQILLVVYHTDIRIGICLRNLNTLGRFKSTHSMRYRYSNTDCLRLLEVYYY